MSTVTSTMTKADYNELMAKIAEGGKVNQGTFDELVEFAKAKKLKRPAADAVIDESAVKAAATTVAGTDEEKPKAKAKAEPKAPKAPKVKAKCDPSLHGSDEECDKDARSNGVCAAHYSRLIHRAKPENAEKAREASRRYAEKARKAKAEAKAAAEATEA